MQSPRAHRFAVALAVIGGSLAIAVGARISVPMVPVPTTLQTLAVVGIGLLGGARIGLAAAAVYLVLALAGLPVLSDGEPHGGLAFLELATAGYVVGFVPAAGVAGWLGQERGFWRMVGAGLASHAVVFALGVTVLAWWVGPEQALHKGLYPFLPGAFAKSLAAAGAVWAQRRRRSKAAVAPSDPRH